jgi:hypothetical protein
MTIQFVTMEIISIARAIPMDESGMRREKQES